MRRRLVVATMWSGARIIRRLAADEADPSPAELDTIAHDLLTTDDRRQGGVRPVVRVLEARVTREREGRS